MPSPLKNNIVPKARDAGIFEGSMLVPMWHPQRLYPSTVLGPPGQCIGGDDSLFCRGRPCVAPK
jgi:hypothetical protein